jgi:hypothetical protein
MDYEPLAEEVLQMLGDEVPARIAAKRILQALDGHQHGARAMMGVLAHMARKLINLAPSEHQEELVLDVLEVIMVLGGVDPDEALEGGEELT